MPSANTYLAAGFLLTLQEKRQSLHFTQFPGQLRKATAWRLALVDALNGGYHGELSDLIADLVKRFDVPVSGVRNYIQQLRMAGFLTDTPPAAHFPDQTASLPGKIGLEPMAVSTPLSLVCQDGEYLWFNHQGQLLVRLSLPEVMAAAIFAEPISVEAARELYLSQGNPDGLDAAEFDALVARIAGADLFIRPRPRLAADENPLIRTVDIAEVQALVDARIASHDEGVASSGRDLLQVVPVNTVKGMAPASLGLLIAYAMEYDGGRLRDRYDFVPMFLTDEDRLIERAATPGVFMFSNYLWNVDINLKLSAAVKAVNPANITVHGGPSSPSYEKDCENFFAEHPHVDITVRGEGELTFAELLDKLNPANLATLENVPGLSYRTAQGVHRTANRERIADLNSIPSPYLMGLFDEFGSVRAGAVIETNRGCPYGCTFCDWGSATLSRVRKFDLDRVYKELEWSAIHQIEGASIADANFGMFERDVDITRKIAELKRAHGYPRSVAINYAKNQVKYLLQIIEIMADVQILTEGVVSMQSMDETTLKVIDRSNIKLEKYNELSTQFRQAKLPLAADIMMGLPGSTPESFKSDLQKCTDRDVRVRANPTQLLPNSPMNSPDYRREHGIVALPGEWVKEAASYTREQWDEMDQLRAAFYLFDNFGLLRYVSRFVRGETGMGEVEFYENVCTTALGHPGDWPVIAATLKSLEGYMAPPGSWGLFVEETRRFVVHHLGLPDDSALRSALAVQLAHLPAPGRHFPERIQLEHDYVAWQDALLAAREGGHRDDWQDYIPRLSSFGPATLVIDDPDEICERDIGKHKNILTTNLRSWELDSAVARPRLTAVSTAPIASVN
jgi:radical SAM superfamily enzyme YgiQ (UPF0313 family)